MSLKNKIAYASRNSDYTNSLEQLTIGNPPKVSG